MTACICVKGQGQRKRYLSGNSSSLISFPMTKILSQGRRDPAVRSASLPATIFTILDYCRRLLHPLERLTAPSSPANLPSHFGSGWQTLLVAYPKAIATFFKKK